ncbi:MAG: septum formation protein Maf [Ruminococcaceae bacterium]|nr:septum formation protein Maf [Oscillospiraceae bacterium]
MRVVLASKSPRRREILSSLGIAFEIVSADADESSTITDPALLVRELALRKGRATRALLEREGKWDADTLIIAADTVVATDREILGKPHDDADAARMLRLLSGSTHKVISGISLLIGDREIAGFDSTAVHFAPMSNTDIDWYVQSGEPRDKAGAYAVQGLASIFIRGLEGCYFNVVGLPVHRLNELLTKFLGFGIVGLLKSSRD